MEQFQKASNLNPFSADPFYGQGFILKQLGQTKEAEEKFGFLLDGLRYGAPPHGGIAFGLDRIVAMMAGEESIRDVIAFPKTQKAACLLTESPSDVAGNQLLDLGIRLRATQVPVPDSDSA